MAVVDVEVLVHQPSDCVAVTSQPLEPGIVGQAVPSTAVAAGTGDSDVGAQRRATSGYGPGSCTGVPATRSNRRSIADQQHVGDRQVLGVGDCNQ